MKASPFCLHRFFATNVVQRVVFQIVAVKVKVKAGFAFTRNRLIYSLLRGEVKGEGKNGKFAECASAYIRVGACPARRLKGILCGVGRLEIKQGRESLKVGTFGEKVGLYFLNGVGEGGRKTPASSFSSPAKVEFRVLWSEKLPVKLIFSAKTEILGEKISRAEEKNTPKKMVFAPKAAEMDEKGRFWGGNHREGMKRKNGLNYRFCHAMK